MEETEKILTIHTSLDLNELKSGDVVSVDVTMNTIQEFFNPTDEKDADGNPLFFKPLPYTHLVLKKGHGENEQTRKFEIVERGWDYARQENGDLVEYEENGEKFCLFQAEYRIK